MAEVVKLTKTELRTQQLKLTQLVRYLPTLQLKKAMLQMEVNAAELEIQRLTEHFAVVEKHVNSYAALFTDKGAQELVHAVKVHQIAKRYENIAGVDIPIFEEVVFEDPSYKLFDTPIWLEAGVSGMQNLIVCREKIKIAEEKKRALEKELREVSIRVNLFEKILIPRAQENIKKIKIFLGDQQLAAVSQAKVAKKKILERSRQP